MKKLLIFLYLLVPFAGTAQIVDTIYANENYNTVLFFPEKIRQGILGAANFAFSYNQENPVPWAAKTSRGTSSSLLVLTRNGSIYSFIIKHARELRQFNYFLKISESIRNERGEIVELTKGSTVNKELQVYPAGESDRQKIS